MQFCTPPRIDLHSNFDSMYCTAYVKLAVIKDPDPMAISCLRYERKRFFQVAFCPFNQRKSNELEAQSINFKENITFSECQCFSVLVCELV